MHNGKVETLKKKKPIRFQQPGLCVVASRSHPNSATEAFVAQLDSPKLLGRGSSLKFMKIADDQADVYPRFGNNGVGSRCKPCDITTIRH